MYEERLELFFDELQLLGEPRETRLVTELTFNEDDHVQARVELLDVDLDVEDLPSNITK